MSTQARFALRGRNPDVLTCIANLSNDEVFTPPELANRMLDTLAESWAAANGGANLWADSTVRFLDPCTKSGVFLREITSRLVQGLAEEMPELEARVNHILTRQVFGIGITQLTSLLARRSVYCSKHANGQHSVAGGFDSDAGNIWFERMEHTWQGGRCIYCGSNQATYDRGDGRETHAYALIHTDNIKTRVAEFFGGDMQFDVIIGNPPYQLDDGGFGASAIPIYNRFVEQAKALEPRFLTMVIPSRWLFGGRGLDEFRRAMLIDNRIRRLVDYPDSRQVFPSVDVAGGICYFLWDRDNPGDCRVVEFEHGLTSSETVRPLLEDGAEVFIRSNRAIAILRKVMAVETGTRSLSLPEALRFDRQVSSQKPFGLRTFFRGSDKKSSKSAGEHLARERHADERREGARQGAGPGVARMKHPPREGDQGAVTDALDAQADQGEDLPLFLRALDQELARGAHGVGDEADAQEGDGQEQLRQVLAPPPEREDAAADHQRGEHEEHDATDAEQAHLRPLRVVSDSSRSNTA